MLLLLLLASSASAASAAADDSMRVLEDDLAAIAADLEQTSLLPFRERPLNTEWVKERDPLVVHQHTNTEYPLRHSSTNEFKPQEPTDPCDKVTGHDPTKRDSLRPWEKVANRMKAKQSKESDEKASRQGAPCCKWDFARSLDNDPGGDKWRPFGHSALPQDQTIPLPMPEGGLGPRHQLDAERNASSEDNKSVESRTVRKWIKTGPGRQHGPYSGKKCAVFAECTGNPVTVNTNGWKLPFEPYWTAPKKDLHWETLTHWPLKTWYCKDGVEGFNDKKALGFCEGVRDPCFYPTKVQCGPNGKCIDGECDCEYGFKGTKCEQKGSRS